ncbi:MAG: histidine kinase [Gilvibacter sp.]
MKTVFYRSICVLVFMVIGTFGFAQEEAEAEAQTFMLSGTVFDDELLKPIGKANIEIVGGAYTTSSKSGDFRIRARIGDQLIIRSDLFDPVYYDIKDTQSVKILAKRNKREVDANRSRSKKLSAPSQVDNKQVFTQYLDSARFYLKRDAKVSIEFITKALESTRENRPTAAQNSLAFELLGDINDYWQQFDLAVENYKSSLRSQSRIPVRIKLAASYRKDGNHQESLQAYTALLEATLSDYQRVEVYEGLGDTYIAINELDNAVENYQKGLAVANEHLITPKITNLNSKIGEAYAAAGSPNLANDYFDNSLELAANENKTRSVAEQNKVADFYSSNEEYDKEIELRTATLGALDSIENLDGLSSAGLSEALSQQRQNYKIANALIAQDNYQAAIPFLEKSVDQADLDDDLVVQKDATRKLSEIYRDLGEFDKSANSYESYVALVDKLYSRKEQELSQAARFSRDIALKQNRITSLESQRQLNESRYELAFENQELIEKNNKVQRWIIASLIALALLLLATAYILRKNVRQQKYANNLLALKSLRTQMNPHFIFNALNSVNSFIATNDERTANKYLSDFSRLMRSVLENSDEDFIPLSKELELLTIYTKLEHFRFKDKFDYEIHLDPALQVNDFMIPPMLLQPYIENAVWHGLRYKETKGKLDIYFDQIDKETIKIQIVDDGIGRLKSKALKTENQKKQNSKGMGNIKKRIKILNEMYKDKVDVLVSDVFENTEGTRVTLILKKD